jgi:hypothetical protein
VTDVMVMPVTENVPYHGPALKQLIHISHSVFPMAVWGIQSCDRHLANNKTQTQRGWVYHPSLQLSKCQNEDLNSWKNSFHWMLPGCHHRRSSLSGQNIYGELVCLVWT